jgi:hypothetical protein
VRELSIAAASEPLSTWLGPARTSGGALARRFELTSRGDRVGGWLWRPVKAPAFWLAAAHDLGASAGDPALATAALALAQAGLGVAAIDLPLHGERGNAKLSRRAIAAGSGATPEASDADRALWLALAQQAASDLARTLEALAEAEPRALPVASLGIGRGAGVAALHAALDARVRAAVSVGARESGPAETRAEAWLARFAPRPLLRIPADPGSELAALAAAAAEVARFLADTQSG